MVLGCESRSDSIERVSVRGTVLVDLTPLKYGVLSLVPVDSGPATGCDVVDGEFLIPQNRGPVSGKYMARIMVPMPKDSSLLGSKGRQPSEQDLPKRYEALMISIDKSTLELELNFQSASDAD